MIFEVHHNINELREKMSEVRSIICRNYLQAQIHTHLRRIGVPTFTDIFDAIAGICDLYSPKECWNYFKAAGYVSG